MRSIKRSSVVVLFCLVLLPGVVCAEVVDWIMAKVNEDIILHSEVQERADAVEKELARTNQQDSISREDLEKGILDQMIREKLTDQETRRMKISVDKGDLDKAVRDVLRENKLTEEQMKYVLSQEGKTIEEFREKIKKEIERARLIERVLKSKTLVSDAQVDAYLQQRSVGAAAPVVEDRRRLAVIYVPVSENAGEKETAEARKQVEKIHERLRGGEDFAKMAREYSKGPGAGEGGDIGFIASTDLVAPIEKATRGLKPGSITGVVETPGGFYILKALEVKKGDAPAADAAAVDATMREKVRRQLIQEEVNRKYEEWIKDLQGRSFIKIQTRPPTAAAPSSQPSS